MSKTFKPVIETDRQFKVVQSIDARADFQLAIMDDFNGNKYVSFHNTDAPALALAILEAALGNNEAISMELAEGLSGLRREVRRVEERDKATRELAELEAEALELFQAWRKSHNLPMVEDWDMTPSFKPEWLAVARRAREMRAEK